MRRTGAVLTSLAAILLGLPAVAASADPVVAAGCVATALPIPPDARGARATAIVEPGTYLGQTGSDPYEGHIWRDGASAPLGILPAAVNDSGLVVGISEGGYDRAARMRLGGTPEYGTGFTYMDDINSAGDAVGGYFFAGTVGSVAKAMWWRPGDPAPTELPGPLRTGARAIDDLGYKIGYGVTAEGERSELIWDADGQIVREFGPYADGDTEIYPRDIDNGVALATRYHPDGAHDLVLVDVVTGAVTALPDTDGLTAELYEDGWIIGTADDLVTPVLWHDGARYELPAVPGTSPRSVRDIQVSGSTVVLAGASSSYTPIWHLTPTIWQCD